MSGGETHRSFHARSRSDAIPDAHPRRRAPEPLPEGTYPMKTKLVVSAAAVLIGGASLFFASPAFAEDGLTDTPSAVDAAEPNEGVCDPLTSGKIDVVGSHKSITITADPGFLITGYCVKAGSIKEGDGPEYIPVDPPQESVVISYKDGVKEISHYSYTQE